MTNILATGVLPLQEIYNTDGKRNAKIFMLQFSKALTINITKGHFTLKKRIESSFQRFLTLYGIYLIIGIVVFSAFVGAQVIPSTSNALKLAVIISSDSINMTILVFLMGYGLVAFPQVLWRNSSAKKTLELTISKVSAQFRDLSDARMKLGKAVADVRTSCQHLQVFQLN